MYDEYYDYHSLASNCEELYDDDNDVKNEIEWENYYHNITEELIDE